MLTYVYVNSTNSTPLYLGRFAAAGIEWLAINLSLIGVERCIALLATGDGWMTNIPDGTKSFDKHSDTGRHEQYKIDKTYYFCC